MASQRRWYMSSTLHRMIVSLGGKDYVIDTQYCGETSPYQASRRRLGGLFRNRYQQPASDGHRSSPPVDGPHAGLGAAPGGASKLSRTLRRAQGRLGVRAIAPPRQNRHISAALTERERGGSRPRRLASRFSLGDRSC